jgi:hypothetical protein
MTMYHEMSVGQFASELEGRWRDGDPIVLEITRPWAFDLAVASPAVGAVVGGLEALDIDQVVGEQPVGGEVVDPDRADVGPLAPDDRGGHPGELVDQGGVQDWIVQVESRVDLLGDGQAEHVLDWCHCRSFWARNSSSRSVR